MFFNNSVPSGQSTGESTLWTAFFFWPLYASFPDFRIANWSTIIHIHIQWEYWLETPLPLCEMLGSTVKQNSLLLLDTLDRNDRKSILGYDLPGLKQIFGILWNSKRKVHLDFRGRVGPCEQYVMTDLNSSLVSPNIEQNLWVGQLPFVYLSTWWCSLKISETTLRQIRIYCLYYYIISCIKPHIWHIKRAHLYISASIYIMIHMKLYIYSI